MTAATEATREEFDDEIAISDILVALGQEKKTLLGVTALGICLSVAAALYMPRSYTASTVLLPPQQQSSGAAAALAQLGALGGMAGMTTGVKTPDDMYAALLQSRSVQNDLIAQFKLQTRYEQETLQGTRKALEKHVTVSSDKKTGFITVEADDTDAAFAAQLANAHVDALRAVLTRIALTDAQQQRQFLEEQVKKTQAALNAAELQFRQAQATNGLVVTQALAEGGVRESTALRAQIAAREVQMQTMARFATPANPDMQRVSAELAAMRRQLNTLEQGSGVASQSANGMQAVQAYRDMKVQEALLEAMIRQLEMARADEAREGPLLQQVDIATAPEKPSKPKRALVVVVGSMAAFMLALVLAMLNHGRKQNSDAWERVKRAWR